MAVSLTNDYDAVRLGLQRIRERGPSGSSDLAAAVDRCTTELDGMEGATSSSSGEGNRATMILTNGFVSSPYDHEDPNHDAVIWAADRARHGGNRLYTYLLPINPRSSSAWLAEATESTGGMLTVMSLPSEFTKSVAQFSISGN